MSDIDVAVYVDVANLAHNGGYGMKFDVLREFACRGESNPVRLNAYVGYDAERAQRDNIYRESQQNFYALLRDFGYKVIEKTVKWYVDDTGNKFGKANVDLDLGVDALTQSDRMNRVLLATGDGDFVQVVRALQNKGCRVEIIAFENVSNDLKREADLFMSGFLIPNLLPIQSPAPLISWGATGSRVRGVCTHFELGKKQFGFMRYLEKISPDIFKIDARQVGSPYKTVFFHATKLPHDFDVTIIPNRNSIFEFELIVGTEGMQAANIQLISGPGKKTHPLPPVSTPSSVPSVAPSTAPLTPSASLPVLVPAASPPPVRTSTVRTRVGTPASKIKSPPSVVPPPPELPKT